MDDTRQKATNTMPSGISDTDLAGIVESAAATLFPGQDSEVEPDEHTEEPEEVNEDDLEDEDDLDELDDLDLEDEDEEDDQELEEDDESDEDEDDSEEDEEESEDEESDEDDSDDDAKDSNLHTVTVQGEQFEVTLDELKSGYQRQEDYTRKTQQVSDIYSKMSQWYEERANDPEFWVQEIVSGQEDPAATIAGAIRRTGDATTLLGQTLKHLVESGEIAEELVEALNLSHIAEQAKGQAVELKVQRLEQQLQERDQQAQQQAEYQRVEQEINRQWADLGLQFEDPAQEYEAKTFLLQFAYERGIPNLQDAYLLMTAQAGDQAAPAPKTQTTRTKAKSAVKKRKTAAMSRKPTGGASPQSRTNSRNADPVADAAAAALAELGLEGD